MLLERIRFELETGRLALFREQESLAVDRNVPLDRFLRKEKDYQQWRIIALLQCGALELTRGGTKVAIAKVTDKLKDGDTLELQSPLSAACQKALTKIPETQFKDYAFANPAPSDDYERGVIKYVGLRPQSQILSGPSVNTLVSFISALKTDERVTHPIRNLIIASHASSSGLLKLPLQVGSAQVITFEDLQALSATALAISPTLMDPRPVDAKGNNIPPMLHIKGCNIGNDIARPLLLLLKKSLGNNIGVTAPKFFHSLKLVHERKIIRRKVVRSLSEIWEFFSYEFFLISPTKITSKANLVAALLKAFNGPPAPGRIDGSIVPKSDWNRWIPATMPADGKTTSVDVAITTSLSTKSKTVSGQLRYFKRFFRTNEWHTLSLPADPGSDPDRKNEIKKALLAQDKRFDPSHPFPFFKRMGLSSIDEFIDRHDWRFKPFDKKKGVLTYSGTRHEYIVLGPVVDPSTNELFMNLFPVSGTPTIAITEDNPKFFGSV